MRIFPQRLRHSMPRLRSVATSPRSRPFIGGSSGASTIGAFGGPGYVSQACLVSRRSGGIDLPPRSSSRGRAWRWRVRAAGLACGELAGRKGAIRLGRAEVLLVQFGLARSRLVPVRLCVASWIRLGRRRRLARLASPGLRPSACPSAARPQATRSQAAGPSATRASPAGQPSRPWC